MQNIFAEICKVDDEQRMVSGYASTEALDVQGEIVTKEAIAGALTDYMKFANVREMHQPSAVGITKSAEMNDKGLYIDVKVVDDAAWNKVKEGVYKGFSIGGKSIQKDDGVIKSLRLSEISLVDRPANPEALIELWKGDIDAAAPAFEKAVDTLADMLNKGDITPERLLKLVKIDKQKPETEIKKGLCQVGWLAGLIDSLSAFQQDSKWEAEYEGDNSPIPEKLMATVKDLAAILNEMVAEETAELTADAKQSSEDVALSIAAGDIEKAGKKISASNMSKMQGMHDQLVGLGVKCAKGDDVSMHDHGADIAKLGELESSIAKINEENTLLKAEIEKLKAMPAPGKALLNAIAISKSDDAMLEHESRKIVPVIDAKGTVNETASLIKMIHAQGGVVAR